MRKLLIVPLSAVVLMTGCASVKLPGSETAEAQFSALHGNGQREIAHTFYNLGRGDAVKDLYWRNRDAQQYAKDPDSVSSATTLHRRYVTIPIPKHVASDGAIIEASTQTVEVVNFVAAIPEPHGRTLFIVK
jgi:hypothetical protein